MTILYTWKWDKGGNRQVIRTGCRPFDTQISALGQGNVFGSTITGWYIRPYEEVECNGYAFAPGELQRSDLKFFRDAPKPIMDEIKGYGQDKQTILYKLFHSSGSKQVVHGYVLATDNHDLIAYTSPTRSKIGVVHACLPYLVNIESMDAILVASAMCFHADDISLLPAIGDHYAPDGTKITIENYSGPHGSIMADAGYTYGKRWSRFFKTGDPYFFPASMFAEAKA
jgi:hypothetical protein